MARKDIIKKKKGEVIHEAKIDEKNINFSLNKVSIGLILFIIMILSILIF